MKVLRADIPQQPMGIIAVANDTNSCTYYSLTEDTAKFIYVSAMFHILERLVRLF